MNNEVLTKTSMATLPMVSEDKLVMADFFKECHLGYSKDCATPIGDLFNTYNMYRNTSGYACYAFQITRTFARWMRTYCPYFQTRLIYHKGDGKGTTCCNIVMDGMSIDEMREYFASTNVQVPVEQAQLSAATTTSAVDQPVVNKAENVVDNATNFNKNTTPCMNTYNTSESVNNGTRRAIVCELVNLRLSLKKAAISYGHLVNSLQSLGVDISQVEPMVEAMKGEAFASCYNYDVQKQEAKHNQSANLPNRNAPNHRMNNNNGNRYQQRQQGQQKQQYHPTYHAPEYTDDELSEDANAYNAQQSRINRWYNNWNV